MRERSYVQSEHVLQSGLEHRRFFVVENFLLVEFGHHYRCNQLLKDCPQNDLLCMGH